ncbi:MAG: hypothetical protein R2849_15625 [Thermomicrobiales bacterium]
MLSVLVDSDLYGGIDLQLVIDNGSGDGSDAVTRPGGFPNIAISGPNATWDSLAATTSPCAFSTI